MMRRVSELCRKLNRKLCRIGQSIECQSTKFTIKFTTKVILETCATTWSCGSTPLQSSDKAAPDCALSELSYSRRQSATGLAPACPAALDRNSSSSIHSNTLRATHSQPNSAAANAQNPPPILV